MSRHAPRGAGTRATAAATAATAATAAASALGLLLAFGGSAAAAPTATDAQIVSGNAFLSNGDVEVGSRANGSFGSSIAAPSGYHPRSAGNLLGFRADRDRDGWGVGTDDGDFFTPGTPYEGWGIQVGAGGTARWNHNGATAVAGSWGSAVANASGAQATWTSSAPVDGVSVTQVVSVSVNTLFLEYDVTLTNTTGAAMTDLYYIRAVDPDNCATVTTASCDNNGDGVADSAGVYKTRNRIVTQVGAGDTYSATSATQTDGSYLGLRTDATDSLAAIADTTGSFCVAPVNVAGFYGTPPSVSGCAMTSTKGADVFKDDLLYLLIRTPSLAAGATRTFQVGYILAGSAAATTPQSITFPPLPDTTMATGTITLAATASSGLPVTYASTTTGVCTVSGPTLTLQAAGTCTVQASQAGDTTFLAATPVTRSFTVSGSGLAITGPQARTIAATGALILGAGVSFVVRARPRRLRFTP